MRAIIVPRFGDHTVLEPAELPPPTRRTDQVLIKVAYAGVNNVDWQLREGWYAGAEEVMFPFVPGWDVAGFAVEVPSSGGTLKVGDRAFAYCRGDRLHGNGSYCELVAVAAGACARVPDAIGLEVAAALPIVTLTALQAVRRAVPLAPTDRVLVLGAGGGVGRQVVQMAAARGAAVATVAAPWHHPALRGFGAGKTYAGLGSPTEGGFDIVIDCAGLASEPAAYRPLRSGGRFLGIAQEPDGALLERYSVHGSHWFSQPDGDGLGEIAQLAESRRLHLPRVVSLPLAEAQMAQQIVRRRATAGRRIVLCVAGCG